MSRSTKSRRTERGKVFLRQVPGEGVEFGPPKPKSRQKTAKPPEWTPKYMGNRKPFDGLDAIPLQSGKALASVTLTSDEVTAVCPLTGQPDCYTVKIQYRPKKFLVESKSVKLWLQSYRDKGIFAEGLAIELAERFNSEIRPYDADITVTQKSRGGVTLVATAYVTDSGIDF